MTIIKLLEAFRNAVGTAIPQLIKANAASRDELIAVVSDLAEELQTGLLLVGTYLRGAKHIDDPKELRKHFRTAEQRLLKYHSEFKICFGLRRLRDRFKRMFDAMPKSVRLGQKREIERLLHQLELDERLVIDGFHKLWPRLENAISSTRHQTLVDLLDGEIALVARQQERVGAIARDIIDNM